MYHDLCLYLHLCPRTHLAARKTLVRREPRSQYSIPQKSLPGPHLQIQPLTQDIREDILKSVFTPNAGLGVKGGVGQRVRGERQVEERKFLEVTVMSPRGREWKGQLVRGWEEQATIFEHLGGTVSLPGQGGTGTETSEFCRLAGFPDDQDKDNGQLLV